MHTYNLILQAWFVKVLWYVYVTVETPIQELPLGLLPIGTTTSAVSNPLLINNS